MEEYFYFYGFDLENTKMSSKRKNQDILKVVFAGWMLINSVKLSYLDFRKTLMIRLNKRRVYQKICKGDWDLSIRNGFLTLQTLQFSTLQNSMPFHRDESSLFF